MKWIAASRPAGDRLCRRRRVFEADGRVPDRCPPAIANHRGGEQQQFALRTALAHDGRRWSTWTSARTSRHNLARSATRRPRASHRPGCATSRTKRHRQHDVQKTASPSCGRERWTRDEPPVHKVRRMTSSWPPTIRSHPTPNRSRFPHQNRYRCRFRRCPDPSHRRPGRFRRCPDPSHRRLDPSRRCPDRSRLHPAFESSRWLGTSSVSHPGPGLRPTPRPRPSPARRGSSSNGP